MGLIAALCAEVWWSNKYGDGSFCLELSSVGLDDGYFRSCLMYSYSYLTAIDSCIVALEGSRSDHKSRLDAFVWLAPFAPALVRRMGVLCRYAFGNFTFGEGKVGNVDFT